MAYQLKNAAGLNEAVIDDNCGISKFYAIAGALSNSLRVQFLNQVDDSDSLDWDFKYKKQLLTLHYNMFNGVSIYPHAIEPTGKENKAVAEITQFLEQQAY